MVRKRPESTVWELGDSDNLFEAMLEKAEKQFGVGGVLTGTEAEESIIGLPLPALCLRWVFQSTVFALGRITGIFGPSGSCKSAFLAEIMRWHRQARGFGFLNETEDKDSPELRSSILGWDKGACKKAHASSTDVYMRNTDYLVKEFKKVSESKGGPRAPLVIGVDSLLGVLCEESIQKVERNDGVPTRQIPPESAQIANKLRVLPAMIHNWPISFCFTNHQKVNVNTFSPSGRPGKHTPGGEAPKYHASFELELSRIKDLERSDYEGIKIGFKMYKNSLGPSRKVMSADLLWRMETAPNGMTLQRTFWDWDTATIELLLGLQGKKSKYTWNLVNNIVDLHQVKGPKVWSNALGIPKEEPVSYRKAGRILEQSDDVLKQLHSALGIRDHVVFVPGSNYQELMNEAAERARAREEELKTLQFAPLADDDQGEGAEVEEDLDTVLADQIEAAEMAGE